MFSPNIPKLYGNYPKYFPILYFSVTLSDKIFQVLNSNARKCKKQKNTHKYPTEVMLIKL